MHIKLNSLTPCLLRPRYNFGHVHVWSNLAWTHTKCFVLLPWRSKRRNKALRNLLAVHHHFNLPLATKMRQVCVLLSHIVGLWIYGKELIKHRKHTKNIIVRDSSMHTVQKNYKNLLEKKSPQKWSNSWQNRQLIPKIWIDFTLKKNPKKLEQQLTKSTADPQNLDWLHSRKPIK